MSSDTKIQIWKQFTTWSSIRFALVRCVIRYKDTNLKAIHNNKLCATLGLKAVSSDTKIQIWKQFTTFCEMFRYPVGCVIRYKDTNLKAIHNVDGQQYALERAVSSDTKIQIWKQFTTPKPARSIAWRLCHPIQRYKFESNSQLHRDTQARLGSCVIRYKDTNLKAIHNVLLFKEKWLSAVSSDTKIQIWKQFTTKNH